MQRHAPSFRFFNAAQVEGFIAEAETLPDSRLKATDVIDVLSDLFIPRGVPGHVRSDNGPEFVAKAVRDWITTVGAKCAFIEPGSPWDRGGSGNSRGLFP